MLFRASQFQLLKAIIILYNALAHCKPVYCMETWGIAINTHLKKLYIIQKQLVRTVFRKPPWEHSAQIFKKKQKFFLSFSSMNIEFLTLLVESFTTTLLPIPLTQPDPPRSTFLFPLPPSRSARSHCQPNYQASKAWNKLPFKTNHQLTTLNEHLFQARPLNSIFYAAAHKSFVASQIVDCLF